MKNAEVSRRFLDQPLNLPSDDQEDQKAGEGDDAVEDQMGEQQPGAAADGGGGECSERRTGAVGAVGLREAS